METSGAKRTTCAQSSSATILVMSYIGPAARILYILPSLYINYPGSWVRALSPMVRTNQAIAIQKQVAAASIKKSLSRAWRRGTSTEEVPVQRKIPRRGTIMLTHSSYPSSQSQERVRVRCYGANGPARQDIRRTRQYCGQPRLF